MPPVEKRLIVGEGFSVAKQLESLRKENQNIDLITVVKRDVDIKINREELRDLINTAQRTADFATEIKFEAPPETKIFQADYSDYEKSISVFSNEQQILYDLDGKMWFFKKLSKDELNESKYLEKKLSIDSILTKLDIPSQEIQPFKMENQQLLAIKVIDEQGLVARLLVEDLIEGKTRNFSGKDIPALAENLKRKLSNLNLESKIDSFRDRKNVDTHNSRLSNQAQEIQVEKPSPITQPQGKKTCYQQP